jgi:hypothetical protein
VRRSVSPRHFFVNSLILLGVLLYLELGREQPAYDQLIQARSLDPDGGVGWQAGRLLERYFP